MRTGGNGVQNGEGRGPGRLRDLAALQRIGAVLRILRIIGIVASVAAFLVFVFSDNWLARVMERAVRQELEEEGLTPSDMRPTPIEGFSVAGTAPVEGDLYGSTLSADGSGVWIASGDGRLIHYGIAEGTVTRSLPLDEMPSPRDVALAPDGRLLVADPSGIVGYVDSDGNVEVVYRREGAAVELFPVQAVQDGEALLILNGGPSPGIVVWTGEAAVARYGYGHVTDMVARDGYVYVSGGHESGLPVAKLSRAGVDTFVPVDTTWIWALSYWDRPFVSLDVDELGFITIVDQAGHLVQLSPGARVILHAPPHGDGLGDARSVTALPGGALLVVYARGLRTYRLNEAGTMMREAVVAASRGDGPGALLLFEQLVEREPRLQSLRRWLAGAYLSLGRPQDAAKHFYLASDREGFKAAVAAEAYNVRKNRLWGVWVMIMAVTVVIWTLDALLSFLLEAWTEEEA